MTNVNSNEASKLMRAYSQIEEKIRVHEIRTETTYSSPVNFVESMKRPRHSWFPYKEGFSPSFVRQFLQQSSDLSDGTILDPFSGSGTTALVAGEVGLRGVGLDVSPLTTFIAKTKATVLTSKEATSFRKQINHFKGSKLSKMAKKPDNPTVARYFEPEVLEGLLKVKAYFSEIESEKLRDLFKLSFLCAIEPYSTHRKAGNGVKKKTNYRFPCDEENVDENIKLYLASNLMKYLDEIIHSDPFVPPEYNIASCIDEELDRSIDNISGVLTSPPYANCFDYSKIYMSELWLGDFFQSKNDQQAFRMNSVRSHVHASWDERFTDMGSSIVNDLIKPIIDQQKLWSPKIGGMLSGYFADMGKLLNNIKPRLRKNAKLGFVVGNSFYGGIPVPTDLLLADLGEQAGYTVDEVRVYRGVIPSSQQYKKLGKNRKYMRESLVVFSND